MNGNSILYEIQEALLGTNKMRYKVGDKVRIKSLKEIEKNYSDLVDDFICYMTFHFEEDFPNRVVEIERISKVGSTDIQIKNSIWTWDEKDIEKLIKPEPIYSRFEILDIR